MIRSTTWANSNLIGLSLAQLSPSLFFLLILILFFFSAVISETLGLDHFPGLGLVLGLENAHFPALSLSLEYS